MARSRRTPEDIAKALRQLAKRKVKIGVPAANAQRTEGGITNIQLGFIHEFGAPGANIPARPHMRVGIAAAQKEIIPLLAAAARLALQGDVGGSEAKLRAAGEAGAASVRAVIEAGLKPELAESTVVARRARAPGVHYRVRIRMVEEELARRRTVARLRRQGRPIPPELQRGIYLRKAQSPGQVKPLIDTAQYLRSISYELT